MSSTQTDLTAEQLAACIKGLLSRASAREAARQLGVDRSTLLAVIAGNSRPGTLALLRERLRGRPELLALHHPTERQA